MKRTALAVPRYLTVYFRMRIALTKYELNNVLFDNIRLSKRECRELLDTLFEEIRAALEGGDTVKLEGFGRFQPTRRPKRWARNLKSGEIIPVAERRVVTFRPSKKLTERIDLRQQPDHFKHRKTGT
jgi:integration host factor subunit alpha